MVVRPGGGRQLHADTAGTIRCHGFRAVARIALAALACIALASCGGGPGGGQPDLVVVAPEVSDTSPAAGASLTFSATVHNTGERGAAATTLRVFRSDEATITTSDEQVGAGTVAALAATASRAVSVELRAPRSHGTYYYRACVDAVAGEADTANNCSAAIEVTVPEARDTAPAAPLPDLVVESHAVSANTPAAGANFTFSATVRNAGDGDAAATTLVVYRSEDETITTSDQNVGEGTVKELAASANVVASVELTAPLSSGTYFYGACVLAVAEESDTANNCSAPVPVTVPVSPVRAPASPRPDLIVVGALTYNANPALGGGFGLEAVAHNRGGAPSEVTTLRFYRSTDATITRSDTQVGTYWVNQLGIRFSSYRGYVWVLTPSSKGVYYYGACVDAVAGESDTTNNCSAAVKIKVSHSDPDLSVGTWSTAGSRRAGAPFDVGTEVWNYGGPSEATTLRVLLLPDRTSAPSAGVQVDAADVPALVATQTKPGSSLVRARPQAPATSGWYHYVMCVDAVTSESNTTNNCSSVTAIEFR